MRKILTLVFALVATSCWAQELISDSISYGACIMRDGPVSGINENERFANPYDMFVVFIGGNALQADAVSQ